MRNGSRASSESASACDNRQLNLPHGGLIGRPAHVSLVFMIHSNFPLSTSCATERGNGPRDPHGRIQADVRNRLETLAFSSSIIISRTKWKRFITSAESGHEIVSRYHSSFQWNTPCYYYHFSRIFRNHMESRLFFNPSRVHNRRPAIERANSCRLQQ